MSVFFWFHLVIMLHGAFSLNEKRETVRNDMSAIVNGETIVMQGIGAPGEEGISRRTEKESTTRSAEQRPAHHHAPFVLLPRIIEVVGIVLPRADLRGRAHKRLAFLVDGVP